MLSELTRFDLNLLVALDALLAERNVTRSAERLFVTQQAMSASLRRLREHFGDPLLVRVGREMTLTPLAAALAKPVREALLLVDRALTTQPRFDPRTARRRFRLALSDYASFVILPLLLRRLAEEAPGIIVEVEALDEQTLSRVSHGEIAFVVTTHDLSLFGAIDDGSLKMAPLFSDDFVCVADAAHPELRHGLSRDLYARLPHNVTRFGSHTETLVEKAWRHAGLPAQVGAVAPGFVAQLFMLPGTPLVGTVQRRLSEALGPKLGLAAYECPIAIERLDETLIWHDREKLDPSHAYLREIFHRVAAEL